MCLLCAVFLILSLVVTSEESEIKYVRNPSNPLYGELTLLLIEDLSIGGEEDEKSSFYRGVDLAVDDTENIYILDKGNCRVQKYDLRGNYLRSFGRKGQGPGEFLSPTTICLLNGKLLAYDIDQSRISIFGQQGELMGSLPLREKVYFWGPMTDNQIAAQTFSFRENDRTSDIVLFDGSGIMKKTIASYNSPMGALLHGALIGTLNGLDPRLFMRILSPQWGVFGYSDRYELNLFDNRGEITVVIQKDEEAREISKHDRDKIIDSEINLWLKRKIRLQKQEVTKVYKFTKYSPFYFNIIVDDRQRIYTLKRPDDESSLNYDLFDKDGRYVFKIKISPRVSISLIKKGHIYSTYVDDQTGAIMIKRYRIDNWDKLNRE